VTVGVCIAVQALPWTSALVVLAIPALAKVWKAFREPRPARPPKNFPVWPLWFAAIAFLHTRRAGALLVLGLIVAAVADWVPTF
jgi:1,4-dihydroxy-2-naphthoate octaprenyltransferase